MRALLSAGAKGGDATGSNVRSELDIAVSKVKWRILPLFVVMFIANYIDRVNIGFVRSHLQTDIGIGTAAFGLGAGLFFVALRYSRCLRTSCSSVSGPRRG